MTINEGFGFNLIIHLPPFLVRIQSSYIRNKNENSEEKKTKNLSINHLIHVVLESCLVIIIVTLCSKFVLYFDFVD